MKLPRPIYNDLKAHVLHEAPREACGILATEGDRVVQLFRAYNVAADPTRGYHLASADQLWITEEIERLGLVLGAVYHSHPTSVAFLSRTDVREAYPDVIHVVVGMGQGLVTRGWEVLGLRVTEVPVEIVE